MLPENATHDPPSVATPDSELWADAAGRSVKAFGGIEGDILLYGKSTMSPY